MLELLLTAMRTTDSGGPRRQNDRNHVSFNPRGTTRWRNDQNEGHRSSTSAGGRHDVGGGAARADQPVVRGVGSSVRVAAQQPGPFGQFVAGLARDLESRPGISDNMHTLAAGGYSDDEFVNTCNCPVRMANIAPAHVREWVTRLKDQGVSASTIADVKTILSAIFITALIDQLIGVHPCRGVKTPTVARGRPPSSPPNSSTPSTPPYATRAGSCSSNLTSKPACGGANSPNYACTTGSPRPGC